MTESATAYQSVLHRAVDLLARREHSATELFNKLLQKGFAEELVESALCELKNKNLQSDERFAEAFVNERIRRGYGPIKIQHELSRKGISQNLISAYVNQSSHQWLDLALVQYQKKYQSTAVDNYAEWSKRARFLQSRGFTMEQIRASINFDADID